MAALYIKECVFMKKFKKSLAILSTICIAAASAIAPMSANAALVPEDAAVTQSVADTAYNYTVDGDTFSFYDNVHKISIVDGTLKDGKDISFYGLNDEGNLAVVYFNVEANEGKGVVVENDSMVYVTYADGEISEIGRDIGTTSLFGFDMSIADPSMAGMMKVFNASLGSFLGAYGAGTGDYSAICSTGKNSGMIEYVRGQRTELLLKDDNYITNLDWSNNEAFMANEWGIYSGYHVIDGVDYNTFCFFGDSDDVYYYGYAKTETGYKVLNMKGTVRKLNDRTKYISLKNVDMSRACDNSSQYAAKMSSCLMAAQGKKSMNLDTLKLYVTYQYEKGWLVPKVYAKTSTASGYLAYTDGSFAGEIKDADGNTEALTVKLDCRNYIVTSATAGVFTVARQTCYYGSLNESRPYLTSYDFGYYDPWFWFWF